MTQSEEKNISGTVHKLFKVFNQNISHELEVDIYIDFWNKYICVTKVLLKEKTMAGLQMFPYIPLKIFLKETYRPDF